MSEAKPNKEAVIAKAGAAVATGRFAEAEAWLREALAYEPDDHQLRLYLGMSLAKAGKNDEAAKELGEIYDAVPESFEALFWLSIVHRRMRRLDDAVRFARLAALLQPGGEHALNNLGLSEMEAGNLDEAALAFEKASLHSQNGPVFYNLATVLSFLGRDAEAAKAFGRAMELGPASPDPRIGLARSLLNENDLEGALTVASTALALAPEYLAAHRLLALIQMHLGNLELAKRHADKAIKLDPTDSLAHATLGSILQASGQIAEAESEFRSSIQLEPNQGYAYVSLLRNKSANEEDRGLLAKMEDVIQQNKLPPKEISSLHYGLGKALEDLAEYESAMAHYDRANEMAYRLKFGGKPYDSGLASRLTDFRIKAYNRALFSRTHENANMSDRPIFIVGMMRSGTTLIEQILSCHSQVCGLGEVDFWTKKSRSTSDPRDLLNPEILRRAADEYIAWLGTAAPEAWHTTDKMPANYLTLGAIHGALPNARIIHTLRDPLDTAISIYATPNGAKIDFAHNKANIAHAYKEYWRLMEHWRSVLPSERFLEVRYESLIENKEDETKRIAEFCGLPWEDAMLESGSNLRPVVTPSVWQVRQPLYRSSMGRWKRFEAWLGPLAELSTLTPTRAGF